MDFLGNQAYFMPANIFRLPLCDNSADFALSMFAPIAAEEAKRILKPRGILAVVSSARDHLIEMRETIYDEVHFSDSLPQTPEGFRMIGSEELRYTIHLQSTDEISSLFVMTPFYYKTTEEGKERLMSKESLDVTVNVNYNLFEAEKI